MATIALGATLLAFGGCLLAIAVFDLVSYTIPNAVCVALVWLFIVCIPIASDEIGLFSHLCSLLIVLSAGLLAFRFGVFGGGDVKSWAAVALWYDLPALPVQVMSVMLIGGSLGLIVLGLRRVLACQFFHEHLLTSRLPRLLQTGEPVPYGVAIALGTALTVGRIDVFGTFQI